MRLKAPRRSLRVVGGLLFLVGGGSLVLMSLLGAPSSWYVFSVCALPIVGAVWFWRPPLAAALSIGPLISVIAWLRYVSGMWAFSRIWAVSFVTGIFAAVLLVVMAIRGFQKWRLPVVLSLAFVACAFATDRLFTNKVIVRAHQMYVAVDGHAPWGDVGPKSSDGSPPIVLYRRVGNDYCYDALQSKELRQRLTPKNGQTVTVEYNIFSDFGDEHAYNVRSVDGLLLTNDERPVLNYEESGGRILGNVESASSGVDNCR